MCAAVMIFQKVCTQRAAAAEIAVIPPQIICRFPAVMLYYKGIRIRAAADKFLIYRRVFTWQKRTASSTG